MCFLVPFMAAPSLLSFVSVLGGTCFGPVLIQSRIVFWLVFYSFYSFLQLPYERDL